MRAVTIDQQPISDWYLAGHIPRFRLACHTVLLVSGATARNCTIYEIMRRAFREVTGL